MFDSSFHSMNEYLKTQRILQIILIRTCRPLPNSPCKVHTWLSIQYWSLCISLMLARTEKPLHFSYAVIIKVWLILLVPSLFGEWNELLLHKAFQQDWNTCVSCIVLANYKVFVWFWFYSYNGYNGRAFQCWKSLKNLFLFFSIFFPHAHFFRDWVKPSSPFCVAFGSESSVASVDHMDIDVELQFQISSWFMIMVC